MQQPGTRLPTGVRVLGLCTAVGLSAGILLGGRVPEAVAMVSLVWDKLLHALAYAALAGSWCVAFGGRRALLAVVLAISIGMLDEWLQRALPGRQPDAADLLADAIGATFGAWFASVAIARLWPLPARPRANADR